MKEAIKVVSKRKILAVILSVMLVLGVPFIIVGAVRRGHNPAFLAMMVLGIVFTVVGFYGCPLGWVSVATANKRATLVRAVTEEHLYTVHELAIRLNTSERETAQLLGECMQKGYLTGYTRDGDRLVLNENTPLRPTEYSVECSRCGALVVASKEHTKCPYCGSALPLPDSDKKH